MVSRFISRVFGWGGGSCSTLRRQRPGRKLAAAAGRVIEAMEGRVLLSVLYVDASAPGPDYDGASWGTAYTDLQLALGAASPGDEIRIADGTYKPTSSTDRTISFALRDGVAIRGRYAGYGAADPEARDVALNATILSGVIGTTKSYHVLTATGVGPSTILDGVTVTGGSAYGSGSNRYGGGLYVVSASPTLIDCTFTGNSADSGGGIYNASSSPTLVNCIFIGNSATTIYGYGGAMYNTSSSPTLTNCTFSGNTANVSGGMYNATSSLPTLTNCIIWGNTGGVIYNTGGSTPTITHSNIQGGHAGAGNIDADPLFVRSPWTGPDGQFGTADDDPGDLRLRSGSPAVNIGSNVAVSSIGTDVAGNARIQNGTVDLGAHEGTTAAPAPKLIYVDGAAGGGNTGVSWADAFTSLASALVAAWDGDTIRIADGTYTPAAADRTLGFALRNAVAIYGGHAGFGAPDPDARDTVLHATILSGDRGTVGNNLDNSHHVLTASGVGLSTVLDGVTVTGGNANGYAWHRFGGGLYVNSASPKLTNCIISGNSAETGGGMYIVFSSPMLINCSFDGNFANGSFGTGGGIWNGSSSPTLINCSFSGNIASNGRGGGMHNGSSSPTLTNCIFNGNSARDGGGMYNSASSPTLTNCTFIGNLAATYGGAMYNTSSSSPTLADCAFSGNSASIGAGMYNSSSSSSPTLIDCTFSGNTGVGMYNASSSSPTLTNCTFSRNTGRGMHNDSSSPTLTNCTFSGNTGGGMFNYSSSPTLTNCILWGNTVSGSSANSGAGMYNSFSSPTLINCILLGNTASCDSSSGGGIYNDSSSPTLTNCILWGNMANSSPQIHQKGSGTATITYSDIQDGYAGIGNIDADPLFVRMPWTGPDGRFGTADDDAGDLRLRIGSPALDVGSNAAVSGLSTDLAGNARIQNGTVDMGAYEGPITPALRTLYVDGTARGANTGVSWADAYTSLQVALAGADAEDTIRIADGTYMPTDTSDRSLGFALRSTVAICGGYAGHGAADPDARDTVLHPTILSGDIGAAGSNTDNSYHVLTATGVDASAVLDGVIVTGGYANGSGANQSYGGGLLTTGASPTLINCTFSGNSASTAGGGIYIFSSTPTLINCTFTGNSAIGSSSSGGGMLNDSSSPTLINCTFGGNSAIDGGGMHNKLSSPTLTNCVFSGNTGSGMYNSYLCSPLLTNCTFSGNTGGGMHNSSSASPALTACTFSGNTGSGMYNSYLCSPLLTNCTFSGNTGRGMYNSSSSPTLTNCTFSRNTSGGMYNYSSSSPTLTNCTFDGNSATSGGGMYNSSSSPTLVNCTFSGNSSSNHGGGMYNDSSSPTLINCILWGNTAYSSPQIHQEGSGMAMITYSDIQGGYAGVGNIDADPLFVRNPARGPDNKWGTVDDDYGNLRLQLASPCIDRGNNGALGLAGITTDLASKRRFVDIALTPDAGNGTAPIVDMGAYEAQWRAPAWLDPGGVGVWDTSTYSLDIRSQTLVVAADDPSRAERLEAVRRFIAAGRSGGAGIVSSAAGEDRGVIAALDGGGNILVRLALMGDVTLDDQLDGDDYFGLDSAFLAGGGHAPEADLNVDGVIDGRDYFVLDARFLKGTVQALGAAAVGQMAQRPSAGVFSSGRSIVDEVLMEEEGVLTAV